MWRKNEPGTEKPEGFVLIRMRYKAFAVASWVGSTWVRMPGAYTIADAKVTHFALIKDPEDGYADEFLEILSDLRHEAVAHQSFDVASKIRQAEEDYKQHKPAGRTP